MDTSDVKPVTKSATAAEETKPKNPPPSAPAPPPLGI